MFRVNLNCTSSNFIFLQLSSLWQYIVVSLAFICCLQFNFSIKKCKILHYGYLFILVFLFYWLKIFSHLLFKVKYGNTHFYKMELLISLLPSPSFWSYSRLEFTAASTAWCITGRKIMEITLSWMLTEKCSWCGM